MRINLTNNYFRKKMKAVFSLCLMVAILLIGCLVMVSVEAEVQHADVLEKFSGIVNETETEVSHKVKYGQHKGITYSHG